MFIVYSVFRNQSVLPLKNSKYDILNFYLGEEALIVILVLFVKCKIIYFISKHKWRIATQMFANFTNCILLNYTNCILLNYTTSAFTGTWIKQYLSKIYECYHHQNQLCVVLWLCVWQQLISAGVDHNSVTLEPGAANGTFLTQHNNKTP